MLTALKKTEDGDALLLRLYEWAGKTAEVRISLPEAATAASFTNLMEKPEPAALALTNHQITVRVHPFEIVSVRLEVAESARSHPNRSNMARH